MANTDAQAKSANRAIKWISLLGTAFLLGLVPMWLLAHSRGAERSAAVEQLTRLRIQNEIASAALYAERGEYEAARQHASRFYTETRQLINHNTQLNDRERAVLNSLLGSRDEVITLLARSDSAVRARLFDLEYRADRGMQIKP